MVLGFEKSLQEKRWLSVYISDDVYWTVMNNPFPFLMLDISRINESARSRLSDIYVVVIYCFHSI